MVILLGNKLFSSQKYIIYKTVEINESILQNVRLHFFSKSMSNLNFELLENFEVIKQTEPLK